MGDTEGTPPSHDHPLELEATTTEPSRLMQEAAPVVEGMTLTEAANAYGVSVKTVQRHAQAGKLPGAVKVPGVKGVSWVIPSGAMETLGYQAKRTLAGVVVTEARANLEVEQLATRVRELESLLELERVRREKAEAESALKDANLTDLRSALEALPKAIEAAKPRRWWRK